MKKFKGYEVVDKYPEDGWLKGYFYAKDDDINGTSKTSLAYQDLAYIGHKDYILHLLDIKRGERVFDIGCSNGAMMVYCGLLGAEVYGVDICAELIGKANEYLSRYGIKGRAIVGDAKKVDLPDNYFDKVVSSDFFEHLNFKDNILVLKEIKRILKPGGRLVIKTPNLTYLRCSRLFKQIWYALKFKNPFKIISPHTKGENTEHIGLATKKQLMKAIKLAGFMNFKFHYDTNSKIEKLNYSAAELFTDIPVLRDIFSEDLIAVVYKPIILSFFS